MGVLLLPNVSTQNQQQSGDSNHGPISKDLLFSNWLLMYLAGNYCDSNNGYSSPGGVSAQV